MNKKIIWNKLTSYDNPFVEFLSNHNTIVIHNQEELNEFILLLASVGLEIKNKKEHNYNYFVELMRINNQEYKGYVVFEYDNYKGLTFWNDIDESESWYGKKPYALKDLNYVIKEE